MSINNIVKPMLLVLVLGALVFYFMFSPYEVDMLPCPIYDYLHIHCGGCGTQRALHHLLHLEFGLAIRNNLLFPVWIFLGFNYAYVQFFGKEGQMPLVLKNWMPAFVFISLFSFIILRNIPHYPFNLLAPI